MSQNLLKKSLAEFTGTFLLVFFGTGVVHASVLCGVQSGLWQVAVVWSVIITLAIYATGSISGAHLNPAVTVAMMALKGFPVRHVPAFILSQLAGALCAACVLYAMFSGALSHYEKTHGIIRGEVGSERSAMCYGEYFPNPDVKASQGWEDSVVPPYTAALGEFIGTAFLVFMIFALTDHEKGETFSAYLAPVFIGLTVGVCISVIAPLTQAGFNPARDFGPRIVAYYAGWGNIAIPGPRGGFFTVYIMAPVLGGLCGGVLYHLFLGKNKGSYEN